MSSLQPLSYLRRVQAQASQLDFAVTSWFDLSEVPTLNLPLPVIKIWIEAETGRRMVVRLLAGSQDTDTAKGIQRPKDFDPALNARCWFLAG